MIKVTSLNGRQQFAVNPDLIERIHENPDTTLVMLDGARHIVSETMDQVIDLQILFRAKILHLARTFDLEPEHPRLSVVPLPDGETR